MTDRPNKIVVLDTNVLLADPQALLSFPDAEVVIPETVLGELDKLKTSRVDPDLRFRGREVSRMMFELSDQGSLVEGVDMPDGGTLRVVPYETNGHLPEGLPTRNSDDRILATAWQVFESAPKDAKVTLITNDLNMLLKAQTLGIPVARHGEGVEGSFTRRYIVRPFQRYKVPLGILAVAIAVFAAVLVIALNGSFGKSGTTSLPSEFKTLLSQDQLKAFDALTTLQSNPKDPEALLTMANFYFEQNSQAQQLNDPASAIQFANNGQRYFQRYLSTSPKDLNARSDYSALLFYGGLTDKAIQEVGQVLTQDPNNPNGNYNLGVFYWQGRRDLKQAAAQFNKVIKITEKDPQAHSAYQRALIALESLKAEAKQQGISIETTSGGTF